MIGFYKALVMIIKARYRLYKVVSIIANNQGDIAPFTRDIYNCSELISNSRVDWVYLNILFLSCIHSVKTGVQRVTKTSKKNQLLFFY